MLLENKTPSIISLEGGDEQVAMSSGAEGDRANTIEREVRATGRGAFNIEWTLDIDRCPCAGANRANFSTSRSNLKK